MVSHSAERPHSREYHYEEVGVQEAAEEYQDKLFM
jgi:hypothetical protein